MHQNAQLEDYLTRTSTPNGRQLKAPQKAAARSAADSLETESSQRLLTLNNRLHIRMCLIGAGVPEDISTKIVGIES